MFLHVTFQEGLGPDLVLFPFPHGNGHYSGDPTYLKWDQVTRLGGCQQSQGQLLPGFFNVQISLVSKETDRSLLTPLFR